MQPTERRRGRQLEAGHSLPSLYNSITHLLPNNTNMSNHYLDFELQIERANIEGQYAVSVVASPAGETQQPELIPFPFDARDMEGLQLRL